MDEFVGRLATDHRVAHVHRLPAIEARTGVLTRALPPVVESRLPVRELWSHQAAAIDLARAGRSVAVATGTASGKSLCYQVPVVEAAATEAASALLLFPTKALARDQLRGLTELGVPGVTAVYCRRPWSTTRS